MKIGIIGNGFVGKATYTLCNKEHLFIVYDKNKKLCIPENIKLSISCGDHVSGGQSIIGHLSPN